MLWFFIGILWFGQYGVPAFANKSLKWSYNSVTVPTVDLGFLFVVFWSIDIAGDSPSIESTSGFSVPPRNWRAYADRKAAGHGGKL